MCFVCFNIGNVNCVPSNNCAYTVIIRMNPYLFIFIAVIVVNIDYVNVVCCVPDNIC